MLHPHVVNARDHADLAHLSDYGIKLLAEGDSWFGWSELQLRPSSNIVRELRFSRSSVVMNHAYTGDPLRRMASISVNHRFFLDLHSLRYDAILVSGGGNDLIDHLYDHQNRRDGIVKHPGQSDPDDPLSYVDQAELERVLTEVAQCCRTMVRGRLTVPAQNRHTPILFHTYDFPMPRNAPAAIGSGKGPGPWLYRALRAVGAPRTHDAAIARFAFDALAQTLLSLHDPENKVYVVDTRNTLAPADPDSNANSADWVNEIHPNNYGYGLLAMKMNEQLTTLGIH